MCRSWLILTKCIRACSEGYVKSQKGQENWFEGRDSKWVEADCEDLNNTH
jgi:hypothetical protein